MVIRGKNLGSCTWPQTMTIPTQGYIITLELLKASWQLMYSPTSIEEGYV